MVGATNADIARNSDFFYSMWFVQSACFNHIHFLLLPPSPQPPTTTTTHTTTPPQPPKPPPQPGVSLKTCRFPCNLFRETQAVAMSDRGAGSSAWRHEQVSVAAAVATALHHSAQRGGGAAQRPTGTEHSGVALYGQVTEDSSRGRGQLHCPWMLCRWSGLRCRCAPAV